MSVQVRVTTKVDQGAMTAFLATRLVAGVQQALDTTARRAQDEVTSSGRVKTGEMRDTIRAERARLSGFEVVGRVIAPAAHAGFQHEGTANDGQGYIYPRRARVLRFRTGASVVYAPKVRGVKGHPFLTLAMERLSPSDFT